MESGCIFNSRPAPRCIRDPASSNVDPQCEKVGGACKLISVSLPPISQSTIQNKTEELKEQEQEEQKEQEEQNKKEQQTSGNQIVIKSGGPNRLSGPISAYSTTINEKRTQIKSFCFFGDAHFSMSGTCKPCKDIDYKTNQLLSPPGSEDCWDISLLLAETFTRYSKEGKYIDFYIESPFISLKTLKDKNDPFPSLVEVVNKVNREGYIAKLEAIFYNCLFKLKCEYSTLRIHYVDVRLGYKTVNLPAAYETISQFNDNQQTKENKQTKEKKRNRTQRLEKFPLDYEGMLTMQMVDAVIGILEDKIVTEDRSRDPVIEDVNVLMKDLYFSGGQTMAGKVDPKNYRLFELYLISDDFSNDVRKLLDWSQIKNSKMLDKLNESFSRIKEVNVNDNGKNNGKIKSNLVMHRVRAQLYALEKEGKTKLANDIKSFILGEYRKNTERTMTKIMDIWNSVYVTYTGFVNAKYRSMNDVYTVFNAFKKEYGKYMKILSYTITGFSLLMDAYLLGRMFRGFNAQIESSSHMESSGHIESEKAIVYAGDAHISNYVKFFTRYLELNSPMIAYNPNSEFLKKGELDKITRCLQVDIRDFNS